MNRKIEEKRLTLFETAQKFGINATETIRCSQELDSLLRVPGRAHPTNERRRDEPGRTDSAGLHSRKKTGFLINMICI